MIKINTLMLASACLLPIAPLFAQDATGSIALVPVNPNVPAAVVPAPGSVALAGWKMIPGQFSLNIRVPFYDIPSMASQAPSRFLISEFDVYRYDGVRVRHQFWVVVPLPTDANSPGPLGNVNPYGTLVLIYHGQSDMPNYDLRSVDLARPIREGERIPNAEGDYMLTQDGILKCSIYNQRSQDNLHTIFSLRAPGVSTDPSPNDPTIDPDVPNQPIDPATGLPVGVTTTLLLLAGPPMQEVLAYIKDGVIGHLDGNGNFVPGPPPGGWMPTGGGNPVEPNPPTGGGPGDGPGTLPPWPTNNLKPGTYAAPYTVSPKHPQIWFWNLLVNPPCNDPTKQCYNTYTASVECYNENGCATGNGKGKSKELAEGNAEDDCARNLSPKSMSYTGSGIDNFTFNHRHFATDWSFADNSPGGCSSCGGGSIAPSTVASLDLLRIQSLRDSTQPSSFGTGHFLSYDVTLNLFEVNGVTYIDAFNPNVLGPRRYSPSGLEFKDTIYNSVKSVRLYDSAGNLTVSRLNAVRAEYVGKTGKEMHFELFPLDANTTGGRLVSTKSPGGDTVLSFTYAVAVSDVVVAPAAKWRKQSALDVAGHRLDFEWSDLPNGATVLTGVTPSGSAKIAYAYDAAGNLARVTYPDGDTSEFTRSIDNGLLKIVYREAGAEGSHRNKTAYYSNNIAADLLAWDRNVRPVMYNQSSQLVRKILNGDGELTYWAASGGNGTGSTMHRKVYEGGGRLRFLDTAENSAYSSWTAPSVLNAADPFGAITSTREKYGHWSPYWLYAENRSGRPSQMTMPESPLNYFLYDGAGNRRLERLGDLVSRSASDARFNKRTMSVDFGGKATLTAYDDAGNLVSRKTGWVYDASLPAGTALAGLKCAYYENIAVLDDMNTATPVSVQQADTVALGQRQTANTNWGMKFEGKLVLASSAMRTFNLSADDAARLYIDGIKVLQTTWSEGGKSVAVNLTAGVHDFRVDFRENGGAQRLDLTWSGPETTTASGVMATTLIGTNFLAHNASADELTLRATPAAAEERWEYYPVGGPLAGLQKAHIDASGKRTESVYDANRRLVAVKETGDSGELVTVQTIEYDASGNPVKQSDALGRSVTFAYDARNRRIKTAYGDGTTETTTYGTGVDANLVVAEKDRAGVVTKHEYDAVGRCVKTLRGYAMADLDGAITRVLGNPSVETTAYLDGTTDPVRVTRDGKTTEYAYDYKGRLVGTRSFPSKDFVLSTVTRYSADEVRFSETDAHGCRSFYAYRRPDMQVIREVRELVPGALGEPADEAAVLALTRDAAPNPAYAVTDYEKDADGRTLATVDARGVRSTLTYDAAGRVIARTAAAGTPEQQVSTSVYDAAGRLVAQADALGRATRRTYTPAGRVASVVYPDNTSESYRYFVDGKLAERTDAAGYTYRQFWTACCARDFVTVTPKGDGVLKFYDGLGRVTYTAQVKDAAAVKDFGPNLPADAVLSATTMKYDAQGRVVAQTRWLVAPSGVDPKNPPIATDPAQGLTTRYEYFSDLSDARFAPVLATLATQGVVLAPVATEPGAVTGSATIVTNPAGEQSFTITDGAGETVASGSFNK